jgi:ABC transport system ATP-binding/permease protein
MITFRKLSHSFGGAPLLDGVSLSLFPRERACLIGRNGAGKSTLLKIVAGEYAPDEGEVEKPSGFRIAYLPQEIPAPMQKDVEAIVASGLEGTETPDWDVTNRLERLLPAMGLDPDAAYAELSAGVRRRVLLARAVISEPNLLLLDEPTNHLDLPSIRWLEGFLKGFSGAVLFITHDRTFLRNLATRILDLDRGQLTSWDCDYDTYLLRKEALLEAESRQQEVFDKKLAEEEGWLRQGIKARRTRNEGRVRALLKMRRERQERRERPGAARLQTEFSGVSGHKVITAEKISFGYEGKNLIDTFSAEILRGDKIGIIGPNGVGKSTLLRLLLGHLQPSSGTVTHGTNLQIAYFDQTRAQLDEKATLRDVVADGNEVVEINGQRKHVVGYLRDFLFPADRVQSTVSMLSGGERNRLLLARLFARPFNVLVMDEPTNDLDLETLELLEDLLGDFSGVLLLVSHDRAFLDNIVTALYVLEGDGRVQTVFGNCAEAELQAKARRPAGPPAKASGNASAFSAEALPKTGKSSKPRRFLNRERWELERLPGEIEALEEEVQTLQLKLADPALYLENARQFEAIRARIGSAEKEIENKMNRWEELENLRQALEGA